MWKAAVDLGAIRHSVVRHSLICSLLFILRTIINIFSPRITLLDWRYMLTNTTHQPSVPILQNHIQLIMHVHTYHTHSAQWRYSVSSVGDGSLVFNMCGSGVDILGRNWNVSGKINLKPTFYYDRDREMTRFVVLYLEGKDHESFV